MPTSSPPTPAAPAATALPRSLGVFGAVMLTLSCVTPASSLFIVVPPLLMSLGSGTVQALLIAAVLSLGVGLCYAELGTLVPSAGGEYSIVGRLLGRPVGWLVFVISLVSLMVIPPIIALGTSDYISSLVTVDPRVAGAVVMALSVAVGVLDIKSNALVTGVFLGIEVLAAATVSLLGFTHVHQPLSTLLHAAVPDGHGHTGPLTAGLLVSGLAVALFTYNGFGTAIYLSEDLVEPRRSVARTVLWSLLAGVVVITVPVTAICLGVSSPDQLAAGDLVAIVDSWAGSAVGTFVSLCVAAAILNAVIVMVLQNGRVLFASARDRTWPEPVNRALGQIHPRWGSPWVATLGIGVPGIVLAAAVPIEDLLGFTGVVVAVIYLLLGVAALAARRARHRDTTAWRMPLWPLAPVVTTLALAYVLTQQTGHDLLITAVVLLVGLVYWFAYLRPRTATHWQLSLPADQSAAAPLPLPATAAVPAAAAPTARTTENS
ncbi:APC family permease [Streptacidiphilus sp. P02-A3a]|uniref:APC family permease n=1 Tax=Streptacidiphilus sp. P02-A3a TaxID=2704468 RepID=UPI0015F78EE0|nr:APC family permease [Streptacidiphilus sp. P02-A3a]QMU71158.1 APC family permease [Streptacidiphilus sp. P02-A3a]